MNPTIASLTNAAHTHADAQGGSELTDAAFSGPITVAKGGTGASTLTGVLVGTGASAVSGISAVPIWVKYTVPYTSVRASANFMDFPLFTLQERGNIKHSASFTGPGISAVTVGFGYSGDPTAYANMFDVVLQPVSATAIQDDGGHYSVNFSAHAVTARFTSARADLSAIWAGSVDIWTCTVVLP